MAKDPVCGMNVDESKSAGKSEYKGTTYYFCSTHCKVTFDEEPEKHVEGGDTSSETHHHHQHH